MTAERPRTAGIRRDGDVLFVGHHRWLPARPPARPTQPGRWLLTFTVAGRGAYVQGGARLVARAGDLVLVRRDRPTTHEVPAGDGWEFFAARFEHWRQWQPASVFESIADGLLRAHVSLASNRQRIQMAFARMLEDARARESARALGSITGQPSTTTADDAPLRDELMLGGLREILLLAQQDPVDAASLDERIREAIETMGAQPAGHHTVESLARQVGLSPSRFAHLFSSQVGLSPMRALQRIRLQQAVLRVQFSDDTLTMVAEETGFSSLFDFSRQFRRQFGQSPRSLRVRVRG